MFAANIRIYDEEKVSTRDPARFAKSQCTAHEVVEVIKISDSIS
jgi:hypothetical protein